MQRGAPLAVPFPTSPHPRFSFSFHPSKPEVSLLPPQQPLRPPPSPPCYSSARWKRWSVRYSPPIRIDFGIGIRILEEGSGIFFGVLWCDLMASETKPEMALENSMKDLKRGVTWKEVDGNMSRAKDGSTSDAVSCISSGDVTSSIKESEVDQDALMAEYSLYYPINGVYGYYYPGDWEDNGYFVGTDGSQIQHSAPQSDNGSLVYYFPGFQAGYSPYGTVSPGAVVGVDGQYSTQQLYYPSPIYQTVVSPGFFPQTVAYGPELVPAYVWDSPPVYAVGLHDNGYGRDPTATYTKPNYLSQNHVIAPSKAAVPSRSSAFGKKGSATTVDASQSAAMQNQALKSATKVNDELSKGFHLANNLHSYSSPGKGSLLYPSIAGNVKTAGRTWVGTDKQKEANQPQGATGFDMLNEQNRGPRTNVSQGPWVSAYDSTAGSDAIINNGILEASIKKEDFNLSDFSTKYDHAFFFVIKSYSEDDVHKSIKYNVWASTSNGNKRLDNAFQVAQDKAAENGSKCPIFLFFSVNASGQFCGVAEMIGQVDFNKNMDFWQQDKWNGYFPVKWHIIKDIPNPQFRHITLENNDNKPVTNSRDTQEVKFPQGIEMLNIFKNYSAKTCILDDFGFYESRQKAMLDKRIKLTINELDNLKLKNEATLKFTKPAELKVIPSGLQLLDSGTRAKDEFLAGSVAVKE